MLWVALATAIMLLSGELTREADDGQLLSRLLAALRASTIQNVADGPRRAQALHAIEGFQQGVASYQKQLLTFKACVSAADRNYAATQADYDACNGPLETERASLRASLVSARDAYEAAVTDAERDRVANNVMAMPEARLLTPSGDQKPPRPSRSRGLEGVASERHATLPRNVVSVMYGPISTPTFGQRFPSRIVDAGTSYAHQDQALADATGSPTKLWNMRGGVRVGMFDDFEAGALFMPLQLAPKFRFDPVSIFFTQQFRFRSFDLAVRASFQTPGDTGWGIAPGTFIGFPGSRLALRAGVILPMEVGTLRAKISPIVGFNAPVRVTWNLIPTFFLTLDSGAAYDRLAQKGGLQVPLGLGTGYTALLGSKLIEITASFSWDHWLSPAPEQGSAKLEWDAYRVAFGASLYFQAL